MHCRIEGDEVNTLQKIFIKTWNKVTKQHLSGAKYYRGDRPNTTFVDLKRPAVDSLNNMMVGIINREPRTSNAIIRKFYTTAIDVAKDSIQIINPYFTLNRAIKKAIKRAVKRGVKVDIMLSVRSDIPLTPDCGFYNAHQLMKGGCNIWMYMPGFHHTKVIMVDGLFCTVGSANLNSRSLNFDNEANAVIVNKEVTQELCNLFNAEKKESFLLTPKKWNEMRTPWKKFVGWFAHLLAPVL
jgi:cardiolipin synthetase